MKNRNDCDLDWTAMFPPPERAGRVHIIVVAIITFLYGLLAVWALLGQLDG